MADRVQLIFDTLQGKDTLTAGLKRAQSESGIVSDAIRRFGPALTIAGVAATALGGAIAAIGAVRIFGRAIDEAKDLENALIGLKSVASATGQNVDQVTEAAKELASDGMIPLADVSATLKSLLATGLDADKAIEVFKSLRDAAAFNRQGQLSLAEAVRGAADGIKNQNSIMVDNAGITKNLSVLQKEYAESIGTTVGKLTERQKLEAITTGIIREATIFQGDYNKSLATYTGAVGKAAGNIRFFLAELGNLIIRNKIVINSISQIGVLFGRLKTAILDNRETLSAYITEGLLKLGSTLNLIANSLDVIVRSFSVLTNTVTAAGKTLALGIITPINLMIQALDQIARKIPGVGNKFSDLADSTSRIMNDLSDSFQEDLGDIERSFTEMTGIVNVGQDLEDFIQKVNKLDRAIATPKKVQLDMVVSKDGFDFGKFFRSFTDKLAGLDYGGIFGKIGPQIAGSVAQGAEGARKAISLLGGKIADAIIPGLGQAVSPLLDLLSQGEEAVRTFVNEFTAAIPGIIQNIIENLPVLIEALVTGLTDALIVLAEKMDIIVERFIINLVKATPRVIKALILRMPMVALQLAKSLFLQMPRVAAKFVEELVRQAPKFINKLIKEIKGAFGNLGGGIVKGAGNIFKSVGRVIGGLFQRGGEFSTRSVPSGFPSDTFPARLSSGELVIDRSTSQRLKEFLAGSQTATDGTTNNILLQILTALRQPMSTSATVQLDRDKFADIILNLNRTNSRLA